MYIRITTRCNMTCEHCCYSATTAGEDMSLCTFKKILDKWHSVIESGNGYVTLGGGEPTLNQEFWNMVELAWKYGTPWMVTNGSNKKDALLIAEMAKKGYLHGVLSIDKWHDPISREVIDAFTEGLTHYDGYGNAYKYMVNCHDVNDKREIRTVLLPIGGGRGKSNKTARQGCPWPGAHFSPDESIFSCGCEDAPVIGTVDKGVQDIQYKYLDMATGCYKTTSPMYEGET